jgi:hypothetical protein
MINYFDYIEEKRKLIDKFKKYSKHPHEFYFVCDGVEDRIFINEIEAKDILALLEYYNDKIQGSVGY